MVLIDKEYYYLDLDEIENFVFKKHDITTISDEEIVSGGNENTIEKRIINRNIEDKYSQVRYDMVKTMLDVTYNSGIESEEGNVKYLQDIDDTSIGSKLIFNTLLVYGFIKKKLEK
jgi:hypothetical protein